MGKVCGLWRLGKLGKMVNATKGWDMRVMAVPRVITIMAVLTIMAIIAIMTIMAILTIMRNMAIRQFWGFSQYECFLARENRRFKKQ